MDVLSKIPSVTSARLPEEAVTAPGRKSVATGAVPATRRDDLLAQIPAHGSRSPNSECPRERHDQLASRTSQSPS